VTIDLEARIVFRDDVSVKLVAHEATDASVVHAARVSTIGSRSQARRLEATDPADEGLIRYLMRSRHGSPFEHNVMTFLIEAPIFVWREFMRHRIASYNEESARYKQLEPVFYCPSPQRNLQQAGSSAHPKLIPGTPHQVTIVNTGIRRASRLAYATYEQLLDEGIAREVARMVLPLNIFSSAYVTMNARALMNFLSLRTHRPDATYPSSPQREIEMVAEQMEALWKHLMPMTQSAFDTTGRVCP